MSCAVSSGTSSCGQWPTPSSSTQSACGSRRAEARRRPRPREDPVGGAPDEADRAPDRRRVERPAVAQREVDQRADRGAAGGAAHQVHDQRGRDVLVGLGDERGGAPAPRRRRGDRVGVDHRGAQQLLHVGEVGQRRAEAVVAVGPAARGGERRDRGRAPARGELERHEAAERVAGDGGGAEARRVHRALDGVHHGARGHRVGQRRAARVAGQREGEHVALALERGQHELPRPPGVGEPVEQDERRPGAAAVRRREAHAMNARSSAASCSGASSAMWCPLSIRAPRTSSAQSAQIASGSP